MDFCGEDNQADGWKNEEDSTDWYDIVFGRFSVPLSNEIDHMIGPEFRMWHERLEEEDDGLP